jgi:protein-tyrosine phosphatase
MFAVVASVGGAVMFWRWRRQPLSYPAPESLIIQPESESAGERILPFEAVANVRDVGGYRTDAGRRVRWGRVYRSGALSHATPADRERLAALDLRLVVDLRSAEEVADAPDHTLPGARALHLPLHDAQEKLKRLRVLLFNPRQLARLVPDAYIRIMIEGNAPLFGSVLRELADSANLPVLIHCTAGKDRTGVATALLLRLLGVPEQTVIADYTLSNYYFEDFRRYTLRAVEPLRKLGVRQEDVTPLLLADPATLRATLDHINMTYGSVEAYLRQRAGIDDATIAALRANLLE